MLVLSDVRYPEDGVLHQSQDVFYALVILIWLPKCTISCSLRVFVSTCSMLFRPLSCFLTAGAVQDGFFMKAEMRRMGWSGLFTVVSWLSLELADIHVFPFDSALLFLGNFAFGTCIFYYPIRKSFILLQRRDSSKSSNTLNNTLYVSCFKHCLTWQKKKKTRTQRHISYFMFSFFGIHPFSLKNCSN